MFKKTFILKPLPESEMDLKPLLCPSNRPRHTIHHRSQLLFVSLLPSRQSSVKNVQAARTSLYMCGRSAHILISAQRHEGHGALSDSFLFHYSCVVSVQRAGLSSTGPSACGAASFVNRRMLFPRAARFYIFGSVSDS